jgi:2-oxoisovalerate dehydrogenase E1 component alpha subunit
MTSRGRVRTPPPLARPRIPSRIPPNEGALPSSLFALWLPDLFPALLCSLLFLLILCPSRGIHAVPVFRILDDIGRVVPGVAEEVIPDLGREGSLAIMATMIRVQEFDKIFNDAQRQGRISFYMTSRGEEACSTASTAAIAATDWILPQYREMGSFFWRGLTYDEVANQLCGNEHDRAHGRQLPIHTGSVDKHVVYVKSTLGTHCPHAAGAAYAMKLRGGEGATLCYFGEGCASEGDVPSALNIAAVHGCPTIFFCRNNGYAISTRTDDQYVSDGIAPRGPAYGLPTIRVDGNDVLATFAATQRAREIAVEQNKPVLIEAMTYRIGAHSTSDDDSKYRHPTAPEEGWDSERAYWEARSPIIRFGRYLHEKGIFSPFMEEEIRREARRQAIETLNRAQAAGKPRLETLFTDVYDDAAWMQTEQEDQLREHIKKYPDFYQEVRSEQTLSEAR